MIVLRPIKQGDLEDFVGLSELASIGLTSLPKDRHLLEKKVVHSMASFHKQVDVPRDELYLFALEENHRIIGISAIAASTGGEPLYFYKRELLKTASALPSVVKEIPVLAPVSYIRGPSELCSLFLHPNVRHHGLGRLLSFGRFLFIAKFPERFTNSFFAELRGVIENGISPFWEGVGKHFFTQPLKEALEMLHTSRKFVGHFLPKYPIYINLLPNAVQQVIGKTHPHTQPALNMLLEQGFSISDDVDVFDAGPKIRAIKNDIHAVAHSQVLEIAGIDDTLTETDMLIANERLDFRATITACKKNEMGKLLITQETANALLLDIGDSVRLYPLHPHKATS